jgi:hypothetical protein
VMCTSHVAPHQCRAGRGKQGSSTAQPASRPVMHPASWPAEEPAAAPPSHPATQPRPPCLRENRCVSLCSSNASTPHFSSSAFLPRLASLRAMQEGEVGTGETRLRGQEQGGCRFQGQGQTQGPCQQRKH